MSVLLLRLEKLKWPLGCRKLQEKVRKVFVVWCIHIINQALYFLGSTYTDAFVTKSRLVKVCKCRKENNKFSHTPKNQRNFVHFFALASKKLLKQKIVALDDLN